MTSLAVPVPTGTGWFIITFSMTEFNSSTSPARAAWKKCLSGVSKLALARTDGFSFTIPCLEIPSSLPDRVIVSATSMIWRRSISIPWLSSTLATSLMIACLHASMPSTASSS